MPRLLAAVATGLLLAGCGGSGHAGTTTTAGGRTTTHAPKRHAAPKTPAQVALGLPPLPPGPVPGYLMIADRDNGRILILNPRTRKVVWSYTGLSDPDDAFFGPDYRLISINEEFHQSLSLISLRKHEVVWTYGHPGASGSGPGYLSNPDDAYLLRNGDVMVADIRNCRVLFVDRAKKVVREIGHAGSCGHDPPAGLSSPNGATPLPDGGVLVTEIGGWVDRISKSGKLVYTVRTPTTYPSDAQLLPNGNILVAGFDTPGRVDILTPSGKDVWTFEPTGKWSLDRPSLAVRWPNGNIAITDDWHHRVLVVNEKTKRVVWSYGHLNRPGRSPGYLDKPDGLDLLPAGTARGTARHVAARATAAPKLAARRVGSLPQALSRASAVALPDGRMLVLGGLAGGSSTDQVLSGKPERLRPAGKLPAAGHDASAAYARGRVTLFGGGRSVSVDSIVRGNPATGRAAAAGHLDEPLSDLGAAVVDGTVYLAGGYTGSRYASAVLRYDGGGRTTTVARLPTGLRYAGVAALGSKLYVAGGVATSGETSAIYAVDPRVGTVTRVGSLPAARAYGALVAFRGALYLVGGKSASGRALATVLRIDPASGRTTVAARLPRALAEPAAVAFPGRIVVAGGEGSDAVYALTPR